VDDVSRPRAIDMIDTSGPCPSDKPIPRDMKFKLG
jgi:hypothetical protein